MPSLLSLNFVSLIPIWINFTLYLFVYFSITLWLVNPCVPFWTCAPTIIQKQPLWYYIICFQQCSAHYKVLQMNYTRRSTFAINIVTNKNSYKNVGKPTHVTTINWHLPLSAKINGTQKRTHAWYMHCIYMYVLWLGLHQFHFLYTDTSNVMYSAGKYLQVQAPIPSTLK